MNRSVWWIIGILIILAGGAYYVSTHRTDVQMSQSGGAQQSQQELAGTWRSTEDSKFTRAFTADGSVTDAYEGDAGATMTGTYSFIDPATEAGFPVPLSAVSGVQVVKLVFSNDPTPMYFSILKLDASSLEMSNLSGRGNTLSFTKVQ